jgi:DNA-binding Xre family transcriptional regulator
MATSARIIDALKRQLKLRGITYRGLAERLELSESAVKHMFSTGNFSLRRLDEVCAVLELDIGDLVNLSESLEPRIEQFSAVRNFSEVACRRNFFSTTSGMTNRFASSRTACCHAKAKFSSLKN